jgi:hypothetical protein
VLVGPAHSKTPERSVPGALALVAGVIQIAQITRKEGRHRGYAATPAVVWYVPTRAKFAEDSYGVYTHATTSP